MQPLFSLYYMNMGWVCIKVHQCQLKTHFSNKWALILDILGKLRYEILLYVIFWKVIGFKLRRTHRILVKQTKKNVGPTDTTGLQTKLQTGSWGSGALWMALLRFYLVTASIWIRKHAQFENFSLYNAKPGTWIWGYGHYAKNTNNSGELFPHFQLWFQQIGLNRY